MKQLILYDIFKDVDECTANSHNCHSDATCTNTNGGFTCACKSGFTGPGTTCSGKQKSRCLLSITILTLIRFVNVKFTLNSYRCR